MAEHLSDEEQIETLKRWWRESGQQWAIAVLIAVVGYFGWNGWQEHKQSQAEQASIVYQNMIEAAQLVPGSTLSEEEKAQVTHLAFKLKDEHSDTQYAFHASMMLARLAVESGDLETAAKELRIAMDEADDALSLVTRLRLAKVESARERFDEALTLLDGVDAKHMASSYAETRGDIYLLQDQKDLAYNAYKEALDALDVNDAHIRPLLELKMNRVLPEAETTLEMTEGDDQ